MAEWQELTEQEKKHATVLDQIIQTERAAFDRVKHDYNALKAWLDGHPKVKEAARSSGIASGSLLIGGTLAWLVKRHRLPLAPPPPRRF